MPHFIYHKIVSITLIMANRFGMFYDETTGKAYTDNTFETEYIPKAHCHPKTPVHAKMHQQDRDRAALKRKKEFKKQKKESKKKWEQDGCGHASMYSFTFVDTKTEVKKESEKAAPVTVEKKSFTQFTQDSNGSAVNKLEEEDYEEIVGNHRFDILSQVASANVEKHTDLPYVLSKVASASAQIHSPSSSSKCSDSSKSCSDSSSSIEVLKTVSAEGVVVDGEKEVKVKKKSNYRTSEPEEVKPGFVCEGCGNRRYQCHQYQYGSFLVQEAMSLLDEKDADEITEDDINHRMKVSYNNKINFKCYKKTGLYDLNCWYDFPACLKEGGVAFAHKVMGDSQIL